MLGFKILRTGLGVGSLIMVVVGLAIAFQPKSVPVREVKTGINTMVETGQFKANASKPVLPGLLLLWGGVAGVALAAFTQEPELARPAMQSTATSSKATPVARAPVAMEPSIASIKGNTLSQLWVEGIQFSQLAANLDLPTRVALLEDSIQNHEGGWIEQLLCCPCLLVIGRPGSAKSSFAGALAICREILVRDLTQTIVADPNAHLKVEQHIWQSHWAIHGSGDDWAGLGQAIASMYKRFAGSQGANYVSSIYDEVTAYEGNVNDSHLKGFLPQITSKARAAEEYITIVSHNDTLSCLGGKGGQAKLKNDMVQLNLASKSTKRGKFKPTGTGCIEGLSFDEKNKPLDQSVTLPRWFDPAILIQLFPDVYLPSPERAEPTVDPELPHHYRTTTASLPGSDAVVAGKSRGSDDTNGVSDHLSKVSALTGLSSHLQEILGMEVPVSTLRDVLSALSAGQSPTYIVETVLGMKGRLFSKGKYALQIIKDSISNEDF